MSTTTIPPRAQTLLDHLVKHGGTSRDTNDALGDKLDCSGSLIRLALSELEDAGLVELTHGRPHPLTHPSGRTITVKADR